MIGVGMRVGGYQVVAPLRAGGMATLFLARREGAGGFSRHVAIKVVHPHLAEDRALVDMFVDEAKICARIDHPNVVHVEEFGEIEGTYYLVMEYVHGCSLAQLVRTLAERGRRVTPELAVHVALAVADGLHAAHSTVDEEGRRLDIVHRDVSPQNVLLAYRGYVKLIDFGVAKARGRAQETRSGTIKGKFRYMSPEQASAARVDARTDVYALGIVLWELLTGRKLIDGGGDVALIAAARDPGVVPPSVHNPAVSRELDRAVLGALALRPDDRHPSANRFRQALAQALPDAMAIDSVGLGSLLREVMAHQIEKDKRSLPDAASGVLEVAEEPSAPSETASTLEALTVSGVTASEDAPPPSTEPSAVTELAVASRRAVEPARGASTRTAIAVVVAASLAVAATITVMRSLGPPTEASEEITAAGAQPPAAVPSEPAPAVPPDAGVAAVAAPAVDPPEPPPRGGGADEPDVTRAAQGAGRVEEPARVPRHRSERTAATDRAAAAMAAGPGAGSTPEPATMTPGPLIGDLTFGDD